MVKKVVKKVVICELPVELPVEVIAVPKVIGEPVVPKKRKTRSDKGIRRSVVKADKC